MSTLISLRPPRFIAAAWACTESHHARAMRAADETARLGRSLAINIYRDDIEPFSLPILYNRALAALVARYPDAAHYAVLSADIVIESIPHDLSDDKVTFGMTRNYNGVAEYDESHVRIIPRALLDKAKLCEEFQGQFFEDWDLFWNVLDEETRTRSIQFLTKHLDHKHIFEERPKLLPHFAANRELFLARYLKKHGKPFVKPA